MENFLTKIILFFNGIFTNIYGETFQGYFEGLKYFKPSFFESYLFLFPSYINHLYGLFFYNNYLYSKNNVYYLSAIGPSNKFSPPLFEFKINDKDFKNNINSFSNNIPLKYIFAFYFLNDNLNVYYKYLKNGIQEKNNIFEQIKDNTITELLN